MHPGGAARRVRFPVILTLAVLLAGCSEPLSDRMVYGGANNGTPTRLDMRQVAPTQHLWVSYGGGVLDLDGAARNATAAVTVPDGAQTLILNLTLIEGAVLRPRVSLAGCAWSDEQTWVALGQTIQFGCNDPIGGNATLVVSHEGTAARLRWTAGGIVEYCVHGNPC